MPAKPSLVSLDQAKDWARRLHKSTPDIASLSSAQSAVASMLGYKDWHDLHQSHAQQPSRNDVLPAQASPSSAAPKVIPLPEGTGARMAGSADPCDMIFGPCACGAWHDTSHRPGVNDPMAIEKGLIQAHYPNLQVKDVELLAWELDEISGDASEILDRASAIENEQGCFSSDALEQALAEKTLRLHFPPGYRMIRILDTQGRRVLTLIPGPVMESVAPNQEQHDASASHRRIPGR